VPFSRLRLDDDFVDDTVVDAVDSPLFVVVGRFVRLAVDDKDETFTLRGRLSIDDCEEAVKRKLIERC
jgi:hypothetical protein